MDEETRRMGGEETLLAGRYLLRGLIGQGGMADVELALDNVLDREIAVKMLHSRYATDPDFLARFRREAQAAASLNHPNIVAVYDTGEDQGRPFIVMEFVSGESLRDYLRRGAVPPQRAAEMVGDAAAGLHYAHERGLVHRDIKPGNILVSDEGTVKVADFGIARAVSADTVTQTAAVFGTAAYVAPEQAQGEPVDRRTDVYALGCVLYEALAGRPPFSAESAVALAYKHVSEAPRRPSQLNPRIGPQLDAVVLKAMAKAPGDRYQTARDFQQDLGRAVAGMAVSAPPAGNYATTQLVRRDPAPTLVAQPVPVAVTREPVYEERERSYIEEPPRSRVGLYVLGLLVLALFIGASYLLATGAFEEDAPPIPQVQVRDVVGQDFEAARQQLMLDGLQVEQGPQRPDPVAPLNQVIEMDPLAGTMVDEGSTVILTTSAGPPTAAIPAVAGQTAEAAETAILEARFMVGPRVEQPSEEIDEGLAIGTNPPEGTPVQEGTQVSVIVSTGPEPLTVPDVTNFAVEAAAERLETFCGDAPCVDVASVSEFSNQFGEGRVIRQDPEGGAEVTRGATVTLVVSAGPSETPTPTPRPSPSPTPTPTPTPTQNPSPSPSPSPSPTPTL